MFFSSRLFHQFRWYLLLCLFFSLFHTPMHNREWEKDDSNHENVRVLRRKKKTPTFHCIHTFNWNPFRDKLIGWLIVWIDLKWLKWFGLFDADIIFTQKKHLCYAVVMYVSNSISSKTHLFHSIPFLCVCVCMCVRVRFILLCLVRHTVRYKFNTTIILKLICKQKSTIQSECFHSEL